MTTEFIKNHIKKEFDYGNDIATALDTLQEFRITDLKPILLISGDEDESIGSQENKQYELEFKEEFSAYMKQRQIYENNQIKAYALIWERCVKAMQARIEARKDFESNIKNDSIELLKSIKLHLMNYQENCYEMAVILDSMKTMLNIRQKDQESLTDYTKRFKTARDLMVSQVGGLPVLTRFVDSMPGVNKNIQKDYQWFQEIAFEQFMAYAYLENSDQNKYGTLVNNLKQQQSLQNDQYPKTLVDATNVLSNHKFDNSNKKHQDKNKRREENEEVPELSFAQLEGRCYCCGQIGHNSPRYPDKNKPKDDWHINKVKKAEAQRAQSHVNATTAGSDNVSVQSGSTEATSVLTTSMSHWTGTHSQFYQSENMKNWILLDNESTTSIFCNRSFVTDIKQEEQPVNISTNGGGLSTNLTATVPGFPHRVWYDPRAMTNIFAFHKMEKYYRITYDLNKEKAFVVHMENGKEIRFKKSPSGLYYYQPSKSFNTNKNEITLMNMVEENKTFFSERQVAKAYKARELYNALGLPSIQDFKAIINSNAIRNNPVTLEDINIAERIFGPEIGRIKGTTTRTKPTPVISNYIEIPEELINKQKNVTLCIDTMYVNGIAFLTTVSRNLQYRTAEPIIGKKGKEVYTRALKNILNIYKKAGFMVTRIHANNKFKSLEHEFKHETELKFNFTSAKEHVPGAERNNRIIKERVRAAFHRLPYKKIPKIMTQILVMESTKKLNFFHQKAESQAISVQG